MSQGKFHMSKSGEPAPCKATEKDCPLGDTIHGDTPEAVLEKYEQSRESDLFAPIQKRSNTSDDAVAKSLPTGELNPAKLDEDGNVVRPAMTYEQYYASTNEKHFLPEFEEDTEAARAFLRRPGSQFDPESVNSLDDLVRDTAEKREDGLEGDDREELIRRGADPGAFKSGSRYIITPAGGYLGATTSDGMSDDTEINYQEKSPGSNIVSMTVERDEKPKVDYGVMILGKQSNISPNNPSDNDIVMTAHPGLPSRTNPDRDRLKTREEKDAFDAKYHEDLKRLKESKGRVTVGDVRKLKGGRDFNLNVKLK